jgi:hypothetical protein
MTPTRQVSIRSQQASLALLGLLTLLAATSQLWAADPAIKVSVLAILASDRDKCVAQELESIAEEVQKFNPKLTSFRVAKICCKSLKIGTKDTFDLVNDQVATITIESKDADGCVQLRVTPPLLGEIHYVTTCGKFLPIVTRFKNKNKEQLIVAIRVQPCPGKK